MEEEGQTEAECGPDLGKRRGRVGQLSLPFMNSGFVWILGWGCPFVHSTNCVLTEKFCR